MGSGGCSAREWGLCPYEREPARFLGPSPRGRSGKTAIDEPGNEASLDTESTGGSTVDFQPPERGERDVVHSGCRGVWGSPLRQTERTKLTPRFHAIFVSVLQSFSLSSKDGKS